jgi:hypothetical protein
MGQAKQRTRAILAMNRSCIFCGGSNPATTVDHQPARALFDRREWPEGLCLSRLRAVQSGIKGRRAQARPPGSHRFPAGGRSRSKAGIWQVSRRDAKQFSGPPQTTFRERKEAVSKIGRHLPARRRSACRYSCRWHRRPSGRRTIRQIAEQNLASFALEAHRERRSLGRRRQSDWYSNAYFNAFNQSEEKSFYTALPACPPIIRNKRDLSDQFAYRYGIDDAGELSAFFIGFRNSFIVLGIVAQSDEMLKEIRASEGVS